MYKKLLPFSMVLLSSIFSLTPSLAMEKPSLEVFLIRSSSHTAHRFMTPDQRAAKKIMRDRKKKLPHNPEIKNLKDCIRKGQFTTSKKLRVKDWNSFLLEQENAKLPPEGRISTVDRSPEERILDLSNEHLTGFTQYTENLRTVTDLRVNDNKLTQLNVSGMMRLKNLDASNNLIREIILNNPELQVLTLEKNQSLTKLDVSQCPNLEILDLRESGIKSLTLGTSPVKEVLLTQMSLLKSLDVSQCPNLEVLDLTKSGIKSLTLGTSPVKGLRLAQTSLLKSLDLSQCPNLEGLDLTESGIESLTLGTSPVKRLYLPGARKLESLDMSRCLQLEKLDLRYNQKINKIAISSLALTWLDLSFSSVTSVSLQSSKGAIP